MSDQSSALYSAYRASSGISTDTRTLRPGDMFVALRGPSFDANTLVGEALDRGAAWVVTSNEAYAADRRAIVVADTLAALHDLARQHRQALTIPIIAITGTNGKTTTKELVTAVLARKFRVKATTGNLNNHIGVPLTLLSLTDDVEVGVVEMGANHPGEIATLCDLARPTAGLVTNVGMAHLEGFGSFEGVKATKAELYHSLRGDHGTVFIDPDNADLMEMLGDYDRAQPYVTGRVEACEGPLLRLAWARDGRTMTAQTQLTGRYNLTNCLAAATVGAFFGVTDAEVVGALEDYRPTLGRSQVIKGQRNTIFLDAYNANPTSMAAALDNLAAVAKPPLAVVLAGMRELGQDSHELHRQILLHLQHLRIARAVLIGEEFARCQPDFALFHYAADTEQARTLCRSLTDCSVLVKGSNSYHLAPLAKEL